MTVMLGIYIFFIGFISMIYARKHVLLVLMSMEMMGLGLFIILLDSISGGAYEMIIYFMVMVVVEACLSLSMMVLMVCFFGVDLVSSLKVLSA